MDNGGDQPILQDETGLTSGTSEERKQQKKSLKNEKVQQTLCDKHLSAKLTDYLPSMEQQEDGHRGGQNHYFYSNALDFT